MVLVIDLNGKRSLEFRRAVSDHVDERWPCLRARFGITGKMSEESRKMEVKRGFLAQYMVRKYAGLDGIDDDSPDYSADLVSPQGIKIDVKTESITFDFKEEYGGSGSVMRQAKHNFYPRQLYDPRLAETDVFLVTRIRTGDRFPGLGRSNEKRWKLWICGWVSKKRVRNEGVLIPRGGITEQGMRFFAYRSHNVEFYQHALNAVESLPSWFNSLSPADVRRDEEKDPDTTQQCTHADAQRIIGDLLVRGVITGDQFSGINRCLGLEGEYVPPVLHSNHTVRFVRHMIRRRILPPGVLERLGSVGIAETKPQDLAELERFF